MTTSVPLDHPTVTEAAQPLLSLQDLVKHYPAGKGKKVHSVDGVSLSVRQGEVLGLVGESGCGKSTLARTILRAVDATSGHIVFDGEDITSAKGKRLKELRRSMQFVFQDPYGAFDPKMSLGTSLEAPLRHHGMKDRAQRQQRMLEMLDRVGIEEAILERRPAECSGGQLQRMVIARALLLEPKFLICDEPTSALDASIRAQILNLLVELKDQLDLTLVLISHDLRVVRYLCDRVAVMYLGKIVEVAPRDELFTNPRHPYTRVLLAASLAEQAGAEANAMVSRLRGEPPSPIDVPSGCRFHPRCPIAQDICSTVVPEISRPGQDHTVTCHFWDQVPHPSALLATSTRNPDE
ncbi:peptide ABC transporter ATP-binding protein [Nocardioides gansuensis]|uniref:Peptide ABC transporter ATP-binding protein n=1 Tax=Nocardioides gansuensis TaxID=2138300 RepID=A0A2T8FBY9_9ACTN|nr:ABC transporter ATP-binding protein [Nocardioides gansuensis]PVG83229.1 peptide ABC transporter ATP-binding protein [Nocardioides gansuensis]